MKLYKFMLEHMTDEQVMENNNGTFMKVYWPHPTIRGVNTNCISIDLIAISNDIQIVQRYLTRSSRRFSQVDREGIVWAAAGMFICQWYDTEILKTRGKSFLELGASTIQVLIYTFQDTLACLACDEIKLASLKTRQDEVGEMDGLPDVEGAVVSAVKKAIISQVKI